AFLFPEMLFDLRLGGDARVIGARQPEGVIALHPLETDQDVLEGEVQSVSDMEVAGHVGRRDDDGVPGRVRALSCREIASLEPFLIPFPLGLRRVVGGRQFHAAAACGFRHALPTSMANVDRIQAKTFRPQRTEGSLPWYH